MKNLRKLGKILNKQEQQSINGGLIWNFEGECNLTLTNDNCPGFCLVCNPITHMCENKCFG